jgi:hypothetical protein
MFQNRSKISKKREDTKKLHTKREFEVSYFCLYQIKKEEKDQDTTFLEEFFFFFFLA